MCACEGVDVLKKDGYVLIEEATGTRPTSKIILSVEHENYTTGSIKPMEYPCGSLLGVLKRRRKTRTRMRNRNATGWAMLCRSSGETPRVLMRVRSEPKSPSAGML